MAVERAEVFDLPITTYFYSTQAGSGTGRKDKKEPLALARRFRREKEFTGSGSDPVKRQPSICLLPRHGDVDSLLRRDEVIDADSVLSDGELNALYNAIEFVAA